MGHQLKQMALPCRLGGVRTRCASPVCVPTISVPSGETAAVAGGSGVRGPASGRRPL